MAVAFLLLAGTGLHAQTGAQIPDGAAKLLNFTGQISVMKDSTPWALHVGDSVRPQQMIVTGPEGWGLFEVSDGSKFEVFQNAHVVFRANRGDWKDLLEVWLGKVRVQIEHIGNLPNNNRVRTPSAVISVRGTVFDVEVEDGTEVSCVLDEDGSVEVRHLLRQGPSRILTAGEWIRVYKNDQLAKASVDKGAVLQQAARIASDVLYRVGLGARGGSGTSATSPAGGTSAGDKNTGSAPPPPTAPPPPPPSGPPPPPK